MPKTAKPSPEAKKPAKKPAKKTAKKAAPSTPTAAPVAAVAPVAPVSDNDEHRSGKYVYCIIHTEDSLRFGPIGIGSEPADVHTVNFKEIAAVVSDTPLEVYDPTRENVLAHERVNEVVMRDYTVIPMSFSTVFKTSEDIVELLRTAYDAVHDVLVKMQD
jgi:hypothetical protein